MILLFDIGNTRVKYASLFQQRIVASNSLPYTQTNLPDVLETIFSALQKPSAIYIANVAGVEVETEILTWSLSRFSIQPTVVASQKKAFGVTNGYDEPAQLGVDRWLALLAAHDLYQGAACCVIDCGTAVTIDILHQKGQHQGGWILPGLRLVTRALFENTRQVKVTQPSAALRVAGRSTRDCVTNGFINTLLSTIELLEMNYEASEHETMNCIFTGGDAALVFSLSNSKSKTLVPDLVLHGLAIVAGARQ